MIWVTNCFKLNIILSSDYLINMNKQLILSKILTINTFNFAKTWEFRIFFWLFLLLVIFRSHKSLNAVTASIFFFESVSNSNFANTRAFSETSFHTEDEKFTLPSLILLLINGDPSTSFKGNSPVNKRHKQIPVAHMSWHLLLIP